LHWLLQNRWFGAYIRNYREGRGMPRATKILTLLALWVTLALSAAFGVSVWWARLLLLMVGLGVTVHILRIGTRGSDPDAGTGTSVSIAPPASDEP
jgi:uncharacterized membrane protein YbaN (DUF454 family)